MNMKKIIIGYISFAFVFSFFINEGYAQKSPQLTIGYHAALPAGDFKNSMGKNSFRGFNAALSFPVSRQLRLGAEVTYNDFYEKLGRQVVSGKDGDISAVITNSIQTTPILFRAEYTLLPDATIRPYIGAGAGFNIISYTQYLGEFTGSEKASFKPALSAGAGLNIPFNKLTAASGIKLGANYNYMPFKYEGLTNLNNWGIHAGVYFPL